MKDIYATLNEVVYDFKEEYENIEMVVYSLVAFAIPLLFTHPQLLTGAVVNAFLILAAFKLRGAKILPLVFLPSIAAFLNGVLFGPITYYLIYLMPPIWIGNFVLVYTFKKLHLSQKMNYWLTAGIAAILKASVIFAGAYLLLQFNVIPAALLTAMGAMQLITAALGAILAFAFLFTIRFLTSKISG